jgi:hypothetical protein
MRAQSDNQTVTRASRPLWHKAALLAAMPLAACGGGGGDSAEPPPPAPQTVKVTLRGQVVDAPIANASVSASAGGQSFTATADAQGQYSLSIELPQSAAGSFVTLTATGAGSQAHVQLVSLAGSLSALVSAAGSDGVVTAAEDFATQVTNVSTAEAVLLQQANGGQPIDSEARQNELATAINAADVLDLATAIKLAVDSPASYPLPTGQSSTLTLARDEAARAAFIDSAVSQDPAAFQQTASAIAADPALTAPLAAGTPAAMLASVLSTDAGFTFNAKNRVLAYDFSAGGAGLVSNSVGSTATSWTIQGNTIQLTYAQPVETVSYDFEACGEQYRQVEAHYHSTGASLNKLSERTLAVTTNYRIHYADCPQLADRDVTETAALTLLVATDFQTLTLDEVNDTAQSLSVIDPAQNQLAADVALFNAGGSGSTVLLGLSFQWALAADGRGVTVNFGNGARGSYRLLRDVDAVASDGLFDVTVGNQRYIDAGATIGIEEDPPVFTAQNLPGRYYQFGVGNEASPGSAQKGFRLRFDADGTGSQEDDFFDSNGNLVTTDSGNTPNLFFRWSLGDDDSAQLRRSFDTQSGNTQCNPAAAATCLTYDLRAIYPAVLSGSRYYWIEKRQTTDGSVAVTANTPATYLTRYYDYEAPGVSATAKAAKAGHSRSLPRGLQPR